MNFRDRLIRVAENDPEYIASKRGEAERSAEFLKKFSILEHDFEDWLAAWFRHVEIQPVPFKYESRSLSSDELKANCEARWEAEGYKFMASASQEYVEDKKKKRREKKPVVAYVQVHIPRYNGWEAATDRVQLGHALRKERDYVSPGENWK